MRRTLIASSFAVAALVGVAGVAGGVIYAADSGNNPDPATPTTLPDLDSIMSVLTPEQLGCLVQNLGSIDTADTGGILALFEECGISLEQLGEIASGDGSEPADTTTPESTPGDAPDTLHAATVAAVFELLGLDQTAVDCLVGQAATATPGDDAQAETILTQCGVTLSALLDGIVALDAAAGEATPTTASATASPILSILQEQLAAQGITLTDEQLACIVDNIASYEPADPGSVVGILETCEIEFAPGG